MWTNSQKCLAIFLDIKLDFKKKLTIIFTKANKNLSISQKVSYFFPEYRYFQSINLL